MPYLRTHDNTELFFIEGGKGRPVVFVESAWLTSRINTVPRDELEFVKELL